jgi:hypothetical protein
MHKAVRSYDAAVVTGWAGHPVVSPAINEWVLQNVAMQPALWAMQQSQDELKAWLTKELAEMGKKVQRAQGAADGKGKGKPLPS